jgi:hypothetical protein
MNGTIMRFGKGGRIRAIYNDSLKLPGAVPRRASHVEPIQSGPNAGKWFVDLSLLGPDFQYCLWPPFENRGDALAAEVDHIEKVWIRGKI